MSDPDQTESQPICRQFLIHGVYKVATTNRVCGRCLPAAACRGAQDILDAHPVLARSASLRRQFARSPRPGIRDPAKQR